MIPRTTLLSTALTVAILAAVSQPALADRDERGGHDGYGGRGWHGDIRHFEGRDLHRWRGGRWVHGHHDGYLGWWWVVAGLWYFYPSPVYPYPDPYVPPVVVEQQPPVIIQQAPPPTTAQPPAQPPTGTPQTTQYWYYCEPAGAYYPYVSSCPTGWKKVPATPPDAPQ